MPEKLTLTVENRTQNYGDVLVFKTVPHRDDFLSIAWLSRTSPPQTKAGFGWKRNYDLVWDDSDDIFTDYAFKASEPYGFHNAGPYSTADSGGACMESAGINFNFKPHPRYWVAFGDYKEGDIIDPSGLKNAVELKPEDLGKKIIINKDNTISIE